MNFPVFKTIMKPRLLLLTLAISLALSAISLSAVEPIGDFDQTTSTFILASGEELGISLSAPTFDGEVILPGQEILLPVTVRSSTGIPAYLFAQIQFPQDFTLKIDGTEGLSSEWILMNNDIYYYGNSACLTGFNSSVQIFDTIAVDEGVTQAGTEYEVSVTIWAIQNAGNEGKDPATVYAEALQWGNKSLYNRSITGYHPGCLNCFGSRDSPSDACPWHKAVYRPHQHLSTHDLQG